MYRRPFLTEKTVSQLIRQSRRIDRKRSKRVKSSYVTFEPISKIMKFQTTAETTPGANFWSQRVFSPVIPGLLKGAGKLKVKDVKKALSGDVQVSCSCPAFLYYGMRYILTQSGDVWGVKENRPPDIRNPRREGALCKHLVSLLKVLPSFSLEVFADLNQVRSMKRR